MRKLLLSASKLLLSASLSLLGLMLAGTSARTQPIPTSSQSGPQTQETTKSVAGTVSSIGNSGHSFAVEVNQGGTKQTVQFIVDKDTQVQGKVTVGTAVTVEYVAMADQNVARTVTAQG